jgi:HD-GYP domain-containing protein (c-di-GMP phosphodiesterase class II)
VAESIGHVEARDAGINSLHTLVATLCTVAVAGVVVGGAVSPRLTSKELIALAVLALGGLVTETFAVQMPEGYYASAGPTTIIVAACIVGPVGAAFVGFVQLLAVRKSPVERWLAHTAIRTLTGLSAGFAVLLISDVPPNNSLLPLAVLVAAVASTGVDLIGNSLILKVRGGDVGSYMRGAVQSCYLPFLLYTPVVWLIAFAYVQEHNVAVMALVFGPTLLAQYVSRLVQERGEAYETLTEANLSFAIGMIRALDASDTYTAGHSASVGVYARDLAIELGYSPAEAAVIQLAALLHDVGKIGVPTEILRKPSRLTDEEWREIQRHPLMGEAIIREVPVFRYIAEAIRHHHERPDGTGYPDRLRGDEIPRAALVIGVADAYSAMTQPRVYREARHPDEAAEELARCAGEQFDTDVVDGFLRVLLDKNFAYRSGNADDFAIAHQRAEILSRLGKAGALRRATLAA